MAISKVTVAFAVSAIVGSGGAALAQADSFELPPGIENTRIPRRLHTNFNFKAVPTPEQAAPAPPPFSFKDYQLGMSLDDFTKLGAPIGADQKKIKAICSCEAGQSIETVNEEDSLAKVVQCGFWAKEGDVLGGTPFKLTVAGVQVTPDFRFIEDAGVYRLYEISIGTYSSNFKDMKEALVAKYGNPTSQRTEKMKTESGNIYLATNLIWDNGVSKIKLSNFDGTNISRAKLRYLHGRLSVAYSTRVNAYRTTPLKRASEDL